MRLKNFFLLLIIWIFTIILVVGFLIKNYETIYVASIMVIILGMILIQKLPNENE